jgi:DNA-directed RNA polymerase subunit RPC12/RpoP
MDEMYECVWCHEEFELCELKREKDMGYLCPSCIEAIRSRGEKLCIEE